MSVMHYRLVAAVIFGLLAGLVNFNLLRKSSKSIDAGAEKFVQIKSSMELGQEFTEEKLVPITVPESIMQIGNSWQLAAVRWADRAILFNRPASRNMTTGDIVFHRDVQEPKERLDLRPDEVAIHVPLSGVVFQPELISVGDFVGFALADDKAGFALNEGSQRNPLFSNEQPAEAPPADPRLEDERLESGDVIGPFRLVAIGPRADPSARHPQTSVNVIAVAGRIGPEQRLDRASQQLLALTGKSASRLRVVLYRPSDVRSQLP